MSRNEWEGVIEGRLEMRYAIFSDVRCSITISSYVGWHHCQKSTGNMTRFDTLIASHQSQHPAVSSSPPHTHTDSASYISNCLRWPVSCLKNKKAVLLQGNRTVQRVLADRTNGRRYWYSVASVCLSSVTWSIVDKRCLLEQKLLLIAYRKSHMRNRLVPKWMTLTFV